MDGAGASGRPSDTPTATQRASGTAGSWKQAGAARLEECSRGPRGSCSSARSWGTGFRGALWYNLRNLQIYGNKKADLQKEKEPILWQQTQDRGFPRGKGENRYLEQEQDPLTKLLHVPRGSLLSQHTLPESRAGPSLGGSHRLSGDRATHRHLEPDIQQEAVPPKLRCEYIFNIGQLIGDGANDVWSSPTVTGIVPREQQKEHHSATDWQFPVGLRWACVAGCSRGT